MSRPAEPTAGGQLALFASESSARRSGYRHERTSEAGRPRYRHEHTAEELAAFDRTLATVYRIRPDWVPDNRRLCPGCFSSIPLQARTCGRRWCDVVRPVWGRRVGEIVRAALVAYCELYDGNGRVLATVITCTSKRGWWDTDRCGHASDGSQCSGPAGCRVRPETEERERRLFPARSRAAKKTHDKAGTRHKSSTATSASSLATWPSRRRPASSFGSTMVSGSTTSPPGSHSSPG